MRRAAAQVALDHRGRLPPELAQRVDAAIRHAARSIERRNVGPGYTNIALMGTCITYVAAELYGLADLQAYAAQRLRLRRLRANRAPSANTTARPTPRSPSKSWGACACTSRSGRAR